MLFHCLPSSRMGTVYMGLLNGGFVIFHAGFLDEVINIQ